MESKNHTKSETLEINSALKSLKSDKKLTQKEIKTILVQIIQGQVYLEEAQSLIDEDSEDFNVFFQNLNNKFVDFEERFINLENFLFRDIEIVKGKKNEQV